MEGREGKGPIRKPRFHGRGIRQPSSNKYAELQLRQRPVRSRGLGLGIWTTGVFSLNEFRNRKYTSRARMKNVESAYAITDLICMELFRHQCGPANGTLTEAHHAIKRTMPLKWVD